MKLSDFIDDFAEALKEQIADDQERWGDTWRYRLIEGQVDRMMARFVDYQDQHNMAGVPVPWLKIAGEALIGWVRDNNPDYYLGEEMEFFGSEPE
ncbi:hypothetical protein KA005_18620 [bacterium]|nr:hypothetical protein [bacterium]